jgi:hypothetical protein
VITGCSLMRGCRDKCTGVRGKEVVEVGNSIRMVVWSLTDHRLIYGRADGIPSFPMSMVVPDGSIYCRAYIGAMMLLLQRRLGPSDVFCRVPHRFSGPGVVSHVDPC